MPFRENDLEAVTKRGALQVWQAEFRRSTRLRRMRAIHRGGRGILREGVNFEDVDAVREPAPRGRAKILSGRGLNAPQGNFVGVGLPSKTWLRARRSDLPPNPPMRST